MSQPPDDPAASTGDSGVPASEGLGAGIRGRHTRLEDEPLYGVDAPATPARVTVDTDGRGRHVQGAGNAFAAVPAGGAAATTAAEPARSAGEGGGDRPGGGGGDPRPRGRGRGGKPEARRSGRRWAIEWVVIILIALVVAFTVRTFVAQTFYVPSTSMYPTLKAGDRIVVDKLAFHLHSIGRGDIVVFKTPPAEAGKCAGPPVPDLVKRVIGLPGETISARSGTVYVTGKPLAEPWLPSASSTYTATFKQVHIPANQYFMMGDNRVDSCDSRIWGTVKRSAIVGKVDFIIWPPSQFRFF